MRSSRLTVLSVTLVTRRSGTNDIEFQGMEDRLVEFWTSADEYWEAVGGDPPRPHRSTTTRLTDTLTMTTPHITGGDREQLRQDALQFVQDVDAGDLDS